MEPRYKVVTPEKEVDFPIAGVPGHSSRKKSILHGA